MQRIAASVRIKNPSDMAATLPVAGSSQLAAGGYRTKQLDIEGITPPQPCDSRPEACSSAASGAFHLILPMALGCRLGTLEAVRRVRVSPATRAPVEGTVVIGKIAFDLPIHPPSWCMHCPSAGDQSINRA